MFSSFAAARANATALPRYTKLELHFPTGYDDAEFMVRFFSALEEYWHNAIASNNAASPLALEWKSTDFLSSNGKPIRYIPLYLHGGGGGSVKKLMEQASTFLSFDAQSASIGSHIVRYVRTNADLLVMPSDPGVDVCFDKTKAAEQLAKGRRVVLIGPAIAPHENLLQLSVETEYTGPQVLAFVNFVGH